MKISNRALLSILALFFAMAVAQAQPATSSAVPIPLEKLDRAQRKEWKRRMKEMSPEEFKAVLSEQAKLKEELAAKEQDLAAMRTQFAVSQEEVAKMKASMEAAMAPAPNTEDASREAYEARHKDVSKGVIYKVQIGYFRNKDLSKYFENTQNFSGDVEADGSKKYTLGYFGNYWEADNFKKYLREMGVADAWTVAYRDGKRVALRDVLEGAAGIGMN